MTPAVSVVLASYCHAQFVARAVRSVWAQSGVSVELVVVDDASTDESFSILEELARSSPVPMRVLRNGVNRGVCATVNRGVSEARGTFVRFCASDDELFPGSVATQMRLLEADGDTGAFALGGYQRIDVDSNTLGHVVVDDLAGRDPFLEMLHFRFHPFIGSSMFRREALVASGGFDESLRFEDRDFMLRMLRDHRFVVDDAPVYRYRRATNQLTAQTFRRPDEYFAILDKHRDEPRVRALGKRGWRRLRGLTHLQVARLAKRAGERQIGRREALEAVRLAPDEREAWFLLGALVAPEWLEGRGLGRRVGKAFGVRAVERLRQ